MKRSTRPSAPSTTIIVAILVALAALGGALGPVHAKAGRGAKGKPARKDFTYTTSDCQGPDKLNSIALELSEGTVGFHQILTMNCTAATRPSTVSVSYVKKARQLQVTIALKSDVLADCTCPIGIDGSISGLDKGAYTISFFYDAPSGEDAKEKPIRRTLATKEFSID
jgi:hypothetical protein